MRAPPRPCALLAAALLSGCRPMPPIEEAPPAAPVVTLAPEESAPAPARPPPLEEKPIEPAIEPAPAPEGMRLVPGGTFTMGADDKGELDERPAHQVTVGPFWLDLTEVTNEAYGRCVAEGACRPHDPSNAAHNGFDDRAFRGPKQPVSGVSWSDARGYCERLGKRLPREAEWERAARGDDARCYPWGDDLPDPERAVFGTSVTADVGTHPQGSGPYGHLDLAGNVWEWVEDEYDPIAYARETAGAGRPGDCDAIRRAQDDLRRRHQDGFTGTNPIPTECERVLRGGAFNYAKLGLRASNRVHHPGRFRLVMSGFRCAKDAGP